MFAGIIGILASKNSGFDANGTLVPYPSELSAMPSTAKTFTITTFSHFEALPQTAKTAIVTPFAHLTAGTDVAKTATITTFPSILSR